MLVVETHPLARRSITQLVDAEPDLEAIGEAGVDDEVVEIARALGPDVIVLGQARLDLVHDLRETSPAGRVVVLGLDDDRAYADRALAAGASEYVLREQADRELAEAIRRAAGRAGQVLPGDL